MKYLSRRVVGSLAVVVLTSMSIVAHAANTSNQLNIYSWSNYIGGDTIKNFEKATGIKVRYDTFDSNETLLAKLMAGDSGYDLMVPGSVYAQLAIKGNLLQKLDKSKITNWNNQDPVLMKKLAVVDPGNNYLIDWRYGYLTVGINKQEVAKALGDVPMPADAWDLVYQPKYAKLVSECGISMTDSASDNVPQVLKYLGLNPASLNRADYDKATDLLLKVRPYITKISTIGWVDDLSSDNTCVAVAYSGDINIARARAIETKQKFEIQALIPKSGAILFFDTMAIPKGAANVDNALKFINYVLDPKINAGITNQVFYPGPVPSSIKYTTKVIADDPSIFLSKKDMEKMDGPVMLNQKLRSLQSKTWNDFKIGKKL